MLIAVVALTAFFGLCLWLVGAALARAAAIRATPTEGLVLFPMLGLFSLGLLLGLGLWARLPNELLALVSWLAIAGAALLARPSRHRLDREALEALGLFSLFVILEFSFVAMPETASLEVHRQMARAPGGSLDAWLPFRFADVLYLRFDPARFAAGWTLTDRGPLLGLLAVLERLLFFDLRSYPHFVALGVAANSLFLFPSLLVLRRATGDGRAGRLFVFLCAASAFIGQNVWFTWPKLLAAGLVLSAFQALREERAGLGGFYAALGLLAHPVAWFALPPLLVRARRRLPTFLPPLVATMAPWLFYQRFFCPPSYRLLKWHLFGVIEPTSESLGATAVAYFTGHGVNWLAAVRLENLVFLARPDRVIEALRHFHEHHWKQGIEALRAFSHFHLLGALNPLLVGWALLGGRSGSTHRALLRDYGLLGGGAALVAVAVLGLPGGTINHQWAYVTVVAAFACMALRVAKHPGVAARLLLAAYAFVEGVMTYAPLWPATRRVASIEAISHLAIYGALFCIAFRDLTYRPKGQFDQGSIERGRIP